MRTMILISCTLAAAGLAGLAGCGGSGPTDGAGGQVAETPARAGEVWELARAGVADTPSPAAIAAFVEGLHAVVIDGDRVHAGSMRLDTARQDDGDLVLTLSGGAQARLSTGDGGYALHLGEGEPARLQRRADAGEGKR